MSGTYIELPDSAGGGGGSLYWGDPVATPGLLPVSGTTGEVRLATSNGSLYYWDGSAFVPINLPPGTLVTGTQSTATSTGVGLTGVWGSATSLTVTAGTWLLYGTVGFKENGATLTTALRAAIGPNASGVGLTDIDTCTHNNLISSTSDLIVPLPTQTIYTSSSITYYLNTMFEYSAGSPQHYGRIQARKIGGTIS